MADLIHQDLIAGLSQEYRQHLLRQNNWQGLLHLAGHGGAIVLGGLLIARRVPGWQALLPIQGIMLIFLFTLLHETIHQTAFRSNTLNRLISTLCGFIVLVPAVWFRYFHFAHHRDTNDPARDPELAGPRPVGMWKILWYLTGLPAWKVEAQAIIANAVRGNNDPFVPDKQRRQVRREAWLHLAGYGGLTIGSIVLQNDLLLWVWVIPIFLGQPFLRLYLLAEHWGCPHVPDMLQNTRTTLTNPAVRFIAWNMPYHIEHHVYPAVPFHKLPDFHRHTRAHLGVTQNGYGEFLRQILRAAHTSPTARP
jgi:fatty acid desaturase